MWPIFSVVSRFLFENRKWVALWPGHNRHRRVNNHAQRGRDSAHSADVIITLALSIGFYVFGVIFDLASLCRWNCSAGASLDSACLCVNNNYLLSSKKTFLPASAWNDICAPVSIGMEYPFNESGASSCQRAGVRIHWNINFNAQHIYFD